MKITSEVFDAYLKCPTKCFFRAHGEAGTGNLYADWVRTETESYTNTGVARLSEGSAPDEVATGLTGAIDAKTIQWRLAVDFMVRTSEMDTRLHAVERIPSLGRGRPAVFIPIRFISRNKLTTDDKLLLAFDAFALSSALGRPVDTGKIIHGGDRTISKVKVAGLKTRVAKLIEKTTALLVAGIPPELILRKHCVECEYQSMCRQKAVEKDDLSLLAGMNEKERKKLNSKGIFTVTQLSYTFRPRRRPKKLRDKKEKYHHSLKALAIREKKIHIVGTPELKIEGTPVYLDVEGIPDRDFYYLIGMRIGEGQSAVQHSLWADTAKDEQRIWQEFLMILNGVQNPVLIHYGSYEKTFFKEMAARYGKPPDGSVTARALERPINILSIIFAQVYFPVLANGLKAVAGSLGFRWSAITASGINVVVWRNCWEMNRDDLVKTNLVVYNAEDCAALHLVTDTIKNVAPPASSGGRGNVDKSRMVHVESMKPQESHWEKFTSAFPEFEYANRAARWDYQRDRIYARTGKKSRQVRDRFSRKINASIPVNTTIVVPEPKQCPYCGQETHRHLHVKDKMLYDIFVGRSVVKRWIVRYRIRFHWCSQCNVLLGMPSTFWPDSKYGRGLVSFLLYQIIELNIPLLTATRAINRLLNFNINQCVLLHLKVVAAEFYASTRDAILRRIAAGTLVHVDETRANIRGKTAYVWVFTNLQEVVYLYSDSREGDMVKRILAAFKGVLVSDFYSAYDSLKCPQQKCLLHLLRDLNDTVLRNPFDEELKRIVNGFASILKMVVETVDQRGLKTYFLRKHLDLVDRFYKRIIEPAVSSEEASKCKERFEKNRDKLFTFLQYDGVPWNNNNAEHVIKAFAALRESLKGSSTQKGLEEYLILLSICQTCKYRGLDFLDFLRSGEKDIEVFEQSKRRRRRRSDAVPIASAEAQPNPLA